MKMVPGYSTFVDAKLQLYNARWMLIIFMSVSGSLPFDLEGDVASLDRPFVILKTSEQLARAQPFSLSQAKGDDSRWQLLRIIPVNISRPMLEIDVIFWNCCGVDFANRAPVR